jgi:hypothetical protein
VDENGNCKHIRALIDGTSDATIYKATPPARQIDDDDIADEIEALEAANATFSSMSVAAIKDQLRLNGQLLKGNKAEVVERAADAKVFGSLPRCPECGGGRLKVKYVTKAHGGQGFFTCPGFYDDDTFKFCHFTATFVDRIPWQEGNKSSVAGPAIAQ